MNSPASSSPPTPTASAAPLAVRAFRLVGSFACMGLGVNVFLCVARSNWTDPKAYVPFAVFVPLLALAIWICRQDFVRSFTSPQGRATLLVIVQGGLGLLVLCFALYIVGYRFRAKADFTSSQMFSLSEETKHVLAELKGLDKPIEIFYLQGVDPGDPKERDASDRERARVTALLREYQAQADALKPGRLVSQVFDMHADPLAASALFERMKLEYISNLAGATVFLYGDRIKVIQPKDLYALETINEKTVRNAYQAERVFTNAIRELLAVNPKAVYFSAGHGERDLASCSQFRGLLKQQAFDEKEWKAGEPIPSDAAMVIVLGPRDAFSEKDAAALRGYLDGGGRLLAFFDPLLSKIEGQAREAWGLDEVLNAYGLKPRQDLLTRQFAPDLLGNKPIPREYLDCIARQDSDAKVLVTLKQEEQLFKMVQACAVETVSPKIAGAQSSVLIETPPYQPDRQWLFWADPVSAKEAGTAPGPGGLAGPVPVGASAEGPKGTRVVAVAGSHAALNVQFANYRGNRLFLLAAARWLAGDDELVTQIQPKSPDVRVAKISPDQSKILMVLLVLGLPVAVFFAGMIVWAMRRN